MPKKSDEKAFLDLFRSVECSYCDKSGRASDDGKLPPGWERRHIGTFMETYLCADCNKEVPRTSIT